MKEQPRNGNDQFSAELVQRCVIVNRDERGFGLTVSGDNPVFVQSVREDGAAAKAGVVQGDRIIKVNGTLVTGANHMKVVELIINSNNYVALTLLGRAPDQTVTTTNSTQKRFGSPARTQSVTQENRKSVSQLPQAGPAGALKGASLHHSASMNTAATRGNISGPQPVDEEKQAEWRKRRVQIVCQMLEEDRKHLEEIKEENKRHHTDKSQSAIDATEKRIKNLESQLSEFGCASDTFGSGSKELPRSGKAFTPSDSGKDLKRSTVSLDTADGAVPSTSDTPPVQCVLVNCQPVVISQDCLPSLHYISPGQIDVIPMEEEDSDSESVAPLDTHGPFGNFLDLKMRPAHLAVFLHYLISNSDPSSLLFYLVTDLYQNGTGKEMRKWAYEIYSSFLVPNAPAKIAAVNIDIVQKIDNVLASPDCVEQEDIMKRLFVEARQKALDEIFEQLADFRNKRTLGLGSVFGENLLQGLNNGEKDRARELKVVDTLLMQHFDTLFPNNVEFDQLMDRTQVWLASLATVVKSIGVKPSVPSQDKLLDRCPIYVAKDKSKFKLRGVGSKKAVQVKGHHFLLNSVYTFTTCYQCQEVIWGINCQAYFCSNCEVVIHKQCAGSLDDVCYPNQKNKDKRKDWKKYRPYNKQSMSNAQSQSRDDPDQPFAIKEEPEDSLMVSEADDKLAQLDVPPDSDSPKPKEWQLNPFSKSDDSGYGGDSLEKPVLPVIRSQSMRNREDELRQSKRGGDGNRRAKSDVDADDKSIALAITSSQPQIQPVSSSSSSNVSLGSNRLPESPSVSQELIKNSSAVSSDLTKSLETKLSEVATTDSDLEAEAEIPKLEDFVDMETVKHLKPKEKKRQEVIWELLHTERTHVRNLKILCKVFYNPLLVNQILPPDFIKLLFANIEEILQLHMAINNAMKARRKQSQLITEVGDLMLSFFDGEAGAQFRKAASTFCQHQQYALDALRTRLKKDQKLALFLQEAESGIICRKLQLKDMLPMEMQRLTKYPLLLENTAKYTPEPSEEFDNIKRALDCSKQILDEVNTGKRSSENLRRLEELQRRLDTSAFDKVQHPIVQDYRNLDLRKFNLMHEGTLQWRLGKNKAVDLHVVLFEDLLVLLTRSNDNRLALRFHNTNILVGKEDTKLTHCPLLKLSSVLPKNVATDKKAFFLVSTSALGPQIYELVATSTSEKKIWFKYIEDQVNICKKREGSQGPTAPILNSSLGRSDTQSTADAESVAGAVGGANGEAPAAGAALNVDNKLNDSGVSDASQGEDEPSIERVQVISQPRLINPCEVRVIQPTVYEHAEPVLTPIEKLKRKDGEIVNAIVEKQKILAKMFNIPHSEFERAGELSGEFRGSREARELVLAAVVQANRLLESINDGMKFKLITGDNAAGSCDQQLELERNPPAVPCSRLTCIAAPLMKSLTLLLHSVEQEQDDIKRLRKELAHYKELATSAGCDTASVSSSSCSPSSSLGRPISRNHSNSSDSTPNDKNRNRQRTGGQQPLSPTSTGSNGGTPAGPGNPPDTVTNLDEIHLASSSAKTNCPEVLISSSEETLTDERHRSPSSNAKTPTPSQAGDLGSERMTKSMSPRSPSPKITNKTKAISQGALSGSGVASPKKSSADRNGSQQSQKTAVKGNLCLDLGSEKGSSQHHSGIPIKSASGSTSASISSSLPNNMPSNSCPAAPVMTRKLSGTDKHPPVVVSRPDALKSPETDSGTSDPELMEDRRRNSEERKSRQKRRRHTALTTEHNATVANKVAGDLLTADEKLLGALEEENNSTAQRDLADVY